MLQTRCGRTVVDGGDKPGEWMTGQMELWSESISGEFTSQEVEKTLWTYATVAS
jgi:hypothetical protein